MAGQACTTGRNSGTDRHKRRRSIPTAPRALLEIPRASAPCRTVDEPGLVRRRWAASGLRCHASQGSRAGSGDCSSGSRAVGSNSATRVQPSRILAVRYGWDCSRTVLPARRSHTRPVRRPDVPGRPKADLCSNRRPPIWGRVGEAVRKGKRAHRGAAAVRDPVLGVCFRSIGGFLERPSAPHR